MIAVVAIGSAVLLTFALVAAHEVVFSFQRVTLGPPHGPR